jgi:cobalt/nickel transport system ATP-binding protein
MEDGNVVGSGTPREVFYDESLLGGANLHPPSAVRIARELGLADTERPVTEAELISVVGARDSAGSGPTAPDADLD